MGDLSKRITLHTRSIRPPDFGDTNFTEEFSNPVVVWAMILTSTGKTIFDGVSLDVQVTHEVYIRHRDGVTEETWIEYKNDYYDVLRVENLEEDDEFLKISCKVRGDKDLGAAQA